VTRRRHAALRQNAFDPADLDSRRREAGSGYTHDSKGLRD
jgi:hypothetical protein